MKTKQHEVRNFDDLCDLVNSENVDILSEDLKNWLVSYHLTIKNLKDNFPEKLKSLKNTEIAKGSFTWIDDGKNDLKGVNISFNK